MPRSRWPRRRQRPRRRSSIGIEFFPGKAPNHARNFLRLAALGVYDGVAFHRVAPGFVIQTGHLPSRAEPLTERQQQYVRNLPPEFNDTKHVKGVVSMARGDDPASASTSFFIVTGTPPGLDGVYTAFVKVVSGMDVVDAIESAGCATKRANAREPASGLTPHVLSLYR